MGEGQAEVEVEISESVIIVKKLITFTKIVENYLSKRLELDEGSTLRVPVV